MTTASPPPESDPRGLLKRRLVWLAIALVVSLLYWPALDGPFVYDDKIEVVGNQAIRVFENWRAVLGYNVSRPLLVLSYAFDWHRSALDPRAYHITSIVIHGIALGSAIFAGEAIGRLFSVTHPWRRAVVAAGLWAAHPMVSESVAYITGRSEALCAAFAVFSIGAHAESVHRSRSGDGPAWFWRIAALLSLAGAVLSKEVGVAVPLGWLVIEALSSEARGWRRVRWSGLVPVALVGVLAVVLRWSSLEAGASLTDLIPREVDRPLSTQLTTSAEVWRHYLRLWVLPTGQTLFHDQPDVALLSLRGAGAWLGLAAMVAASVAAWRRRPVAGAMLLLAALFLLPSTSIARLKEPLAEHRAYQTGLWLFLAAALSAPASLFAKRQNIAVVGVLAVVFSAGSVLRAQVWSSEVALWREAVAAVPESPDAWFGLGDAHRFERDCSAAVPAYEHALELAFDRPHTFQGEARRLDALNNLGICRAQLGDGPGAKRAWLKALQIRPSYCKAHNNLGSLHYRKRRWEEARVELQSALAYCPDSTTAHWLLGNLYYGPLAEPEKALVHYQTLVRINPRFDFAEQAKARILQLTW